MKKYISILLAVLLLMLSVTTYAAVPKNSITVSDAVFTDGSSGRTTTVNVRQYGSFGTGATLAVASYNKTTGRIHEINFDSVTFTASLKEATLSATAEIPDSNYEYKYWVWDSLDNMISLGNKAPEAPTNFVASSVTTSTVTLTWTAAVDDIGIERYFVYRDGTLVGAPTSTSFTDVGLDDNTRYTYSIKAMDGANAESAMATATAKTVAILSIDMSEIAQVNIENTSAPCKTTGANGLDITSCYTNEATNYVTTVAEFNASVQAGTQSTSTVGTFQLGNEAPRQCYASYKMKHDGMYISIPKTSYLADGKKAEGTSKDATFIITYFDNAGGDIEVRFRDSSHNSNNPHKILIQRTGSNRWVTGTFDAIDAMFDTENTWHITLRTDDESPVYISRFAAARDYVEKAVSTPFDPTVPTALTVGEITETSVALSWTAPVNAANVAGYKIYRNGTEVGTSQTTSYTDTGLDDGTEYSYTVSAYDAENNESAQTSAVTATTVAVVNVDPPTALTVGEITETTVALSWTAPINSANVAGYKIYRNGTAVGTTQTTSYTDTGLTDGTEYSYTVSAYDAENNESAKTSAVTATTNVDRSASISFADITYSKTAVTAGNDGLSTSAVLSTTTWVDTFDTVNYDTTYGNTPTVSVGNYNGRKCMAVYDLTNSKYGIGFIIQPGHVLRQVTNGDTVTFTFDYYDNGTDLIGLRYRKDNATGATTNSSVVRTGTNTWKTATITVTNADFTKSGNTTHYFWFSDGAGDNHDPFYISNISVQAVMN